MVTPADNLPHTASAWWWTAISSDVAVTGAVVLVAGTAALIVLIRALAHLRPDLEKSEIRNPKSEISSNDPNPKTDATPAVRRASFGILNFGFISDFGFRISDFPVSDFGFRISDFPRRIGPESGVATIEFCLVFPIILFIGLLLAQTTTVMGGNMVVHYAAFAATRAAIVQIPADYPGEPPNTLVHTPGYRKHDAIRHAAVVALWPIAGSQPSGNVPADEVAGGVRTHFSAYGVAEPPWIETLLGDRLRYAHDVDNTQVNVYFYERNALDVAGTPMRRGESAQFGPKDPVSVNVQHRLNLGVPYVRGLFSDGSHPEAIGGMYTVINARYTLTNEGIIDDLPPLPDLERDP